MSDIIFVRPIAEEIARIVETLRTTLSLRSVIIGEMNFQPTAGLTNLVNGVWIIPSPNTTIDPDALPKQLQERYFYRVVYVRRIGLGENVTKVRMADVATIVNTLTDHIHPDITSMPVTAEVLWMLVRNIEWEPSEDGMVQTFGADMTAVAFSLEAHVRCRRG